MTTRPTKQLDTFQNPRPGREYEIAFEAPEFTCLCPKTGQPDFATLRIRYAPDATCVELKSLKLYLWSFRDEGHFHEDVTNRILDDLVAATQPRWMEVVGDFYVRGGIHTVVTVRHGTVPGHRVTVPGHHVTVPGHHVTAPGQHVTAPGRHVTAPGQHGTAPTHEIPPR